MSIEEAKIFIQEGIEEGYFDEDEFEDMSEEEILEFAMREKEIEDLIRSEG